MATLEPVLGTSLGKIPETLPNPALWGALLLNVPSPQTPNVPSTQASNITGAPLSPAHRLWAGRKGTSGWGVLTQPPFCSQARGARGRRACWEPGSPPANPLSGPLHTPSPSLRPPPHALRERRDLVERIGHGDRAERQSRYLARQRRHVHSGGAGTPARPRATSRVLRSSAAARLGRRLPRTQPGPAPRKGRPPLRSRPAAAVMAPPRSPGVSEDPLSLSIPLLDSVRSPTPGLSFPING